MSKPVVLITGALTGIGRATAFAFAQEGARVVVSGRRDDAGEALATELRATGAEVEFIRADVRHENDVQNLVDKTVARFGRLDVAVNNAGTEGKPGPVTEQTAESYAATFDTNVLGVLLSMNVLRRWKMAAAYCQAVLSHDQHIVLDGAPAETVRCRLPRPVPQPFIMFQNSPRARRAARGLAESPGALQQLRAALEQGVDALR
jgi:NAD(P)-dependent dehydrogenase (short-subunit alcohol dehydrogenase family)